MTDKVSWAIKKLEGEHKTCGRLEENPMVSSAWLCRHLLQDLETNLDILVDSLQRMCMERYRLNLKLRLFYKVKVLARVQIHGGFVESYGLLPKYAKMIKATNLGSYALVTWTDGGMKDPNSRLVLFHLQLRNLRLLFMQYGCQKDDWTFISDRMRGVESTLFEVFPRAIRRICCQHLYSNYKNAGWSRTAFHKLFWIAANAYNEYVFEKTISKIKKYDAAAEQYLRDIEEQLSIHKFDRRVCSDHNTTNFVESFKACIKPNRDMPILTLLEVVRNWCMKRIGARFDKSIDMEPTQLTKYAKGILESRSEDFRFCHVTAYGGGEFEVRDGHVKFLVTLGNMTCGCGKWQGSGIPCIHGLRVIYNQRLQATDYVSAYFKGAAYKMTYGDHIHPMANPTHWQGLMSQKMCRETSKAKKEGP